MGTKCCPVPARPRMSFVNSTTAGVYHVTGLPLGAVTNDAGGGSVAYTNFTASVNTDPLLSVFQEPTVGVIQNNNQFSAFIREVGIILPADGSNGDAEVRIKTFGSATLQNLWKTSGSNIMRWQPEIWCQRGFAIETTLDSGAGTTAARCYVSWDISPFVGGF